MGEIGEDPVTGATHTKDGAGSILLKEKKKNPQQHSELSETNIPREGTGKVHFCLTSMLPATFVFVFVLILCYF